MTADLEPDDWDHDGGDLEEILLTDRDWWTLAFIMALLVVAVVVLGWRIFENISKTSQKPGPDHVEGAEEKP